jgi:hypothetical protein
VVLKAVGSFSLLIGHALGMLGDEGSYREASDARGSEFPRIAARGKVLPVGHLTAKQVGWDA